MASRCGTCAGAAGRRRRPVTLPGVVTERSITPAQLTRLFDAAAEVVEQRDLREVLDAIMGTAMQLTGARYAAVGVIGSHGGLREFIHRGMDDDTVNAIGTYPVGVGLLGAITHTVDVTRLERLSDHPSSTGFPPNHPPMESFIGVALRTGGRVFGNLYLTEKEGGFDESDELTIAALAVVGGAAVSNAQIHERLGQLALAEDRERIARDVHDGVIQDLFAVGLGLQGTAARTGEGELQEQLVGAVGKLDECISALRGVIFDLRHTEFQSDLVHEARELVEELAEPYTASIRFTPATALPDLPERSAETVLAMIKESVSNALRHSGAGAVQVSLSATGGMIRIVVADDGSGFDPDNVARGMGLSNLERRAAEAGGTLSIDTAPGAGTRLAIEIPH